jgi:hypothetical protein
MLTEPVTHIERLLSFCNVSDVKTESLIGLVDQRKISPHGRDGHSGLLRRALRSNLFVSLGYGELLEDRGDEH